ncbi:cupin domain-containing protein [Candidatus Nomurabacteria bacterium]|uniref:Cupin domain-containing protein n=1 Tax=candidate division WWE3 bacterium TaxID=2053526 RepID=A0A955E0D4_UNCKA|nr:cupin domain-containing protein [candidate division WWE3 bacterium]MCB9823999.1 cupin domain-containing protein [Candidatus Nomurabacteria bacterium]MCB9827030.1 cupin domain-containing protein [Candidatus Nomurabacteria bacterium]MCB9827940.1 cupin domain-containing protein [Candidatus Nomurabacteria bacterium]HXK52818.1 cupin domain-containing protein [bacterium]
MNNYLDNIQKLTLENKNFRKVLFTGKHTQLVIMSLLPGEEIGLEIHPDTDQFFRIEQGQAKIIMDGQEFFAEDDYAIIITAGTEHNVINASETEVLKMYTLYSPPNHPEGTIHKNKEEADLYERSH